MKTIKKLLAVALTLAMVMGMMSISAMAADVTYEDVETWYLTGDFNNWSWEAMSANDIAGTYVLKVELEAGTTYEYGIASNKDSHAFYVAGSDYKNYSCTPETSGTYKFTFNANALASATASSYEGGDTWDPGTNYYVDSSVTVLYVESEEETTTATDETTTATDETTSAGDSDDNPTTTAASEDTADNGSGDHTVAVLFGAVAVLCVAVIATKKFAVEK